MEESNEFQDGYVKSLILQGASKISNETFEDEMMLKIQASIDHKKEVTAKLSLDIRYFRIATIMGITMAVILLTKRMSFSVNLLYPGVISLFVLSVAGIMIMGNLKRFMRLYKY